MALKGVKIKETFNDFLADHPEIKLNRDESGGVVNISPAKPGVEILSQTVINNQPVQVVYVYQEQEYVFPPLHY